MQQHADTSSYADRGERARRIEALAARTADALKLRDSARARFINEAVRGLVFEPQVAAAGTVMEPSRARRRQLRRSLHESEFGLLAILLAVMFVLARQLDASGPLILVFLVVLYAVIITAVKVLRWRADIASVYAALPPPGSIILADPTALTVNGIVIAWNNVALETVSLRISRWPFIFMRGSYTIDRLTLVANGNRLALDRAVVTDGQDLLDTICDKLDLSRRPALAGDVNAQNLPLYPRPHPIAGWPPSGATMTTFDKREEGFEKKFAHDEELRFKATARRNKLLGLWAADKLGLKGTQADAYAKEVVMSDFEEAGDHDVFRKVRKDFDAKGVALSDQQIRTAMNDLMEKAIAEIKASG